MIKRGNSIYYNGWYYVLEQGKMPYIQERVDSVVYANYQTILLDKMFLARICDANDASGVPFGNKPQLIDPFTAAYDGQVLFHLEEPEMVAQVTATMMMKG